MTIELIKDNLKSNAIYLADKKIYDKPSVIGYEKKFRWAWIATQLNTFIVVTDFGDELVTVALIEKHLATSFNFATKNYTGWPRGLQSAIGVVSVLISTNIDKDAIEYCLKLKSGKKWAGFSIPVVMNSSTSSIYSFENTPLWGAIYFPHFKKLINSLTVQ